MKSCPLPWVSYQFLHLGESAWDTETGDWPERPLFNGWAHPTPSRAPSGRHETFNFHADTNPGYR